MSYRPPVFDLIRDNILKSGNPLGLKGETFTAWADGLNLAREGGTFLYTGLEYQLLPYLNGLQNAVRVMGPFGERLSLARGVLGVFDRLGLDVMKAVKDTGSAERITALLRSAVALLRRSGIEPAYLYEDEPYAGSLLYEMGFQTEVAEHGRRLAELFGRRGVKRLIVLSPHSLEMFRKIFPALGVRLDFEALHYTEILAPGAAAAAAPAGDAVYSIHDPCHLSRSLGIIDEPRRLLASAGIGCREIPHTNGRYTTCCGAPIETYLPELAGLLAEARVAEFAAAGLSRVVVICPFCFFNLSHAATDAAKTKNAGGAEPVVEVTDLLELLGPAPNAGGR